MGREEEEPVPPPQKKKYFGLEPPLDALRLGR